MLLLVLILVVLAFGLLVFALQAGSVIAAWVSVGLSVAAALVLLVDWLQRRSAMRAGAASLEAAGERSPARDRELEHDAEPATEVLPVVPPSGPLPVQGEGSGAGDEPTAVAARPGGRAPGASAAADAGETRTGGDSGDAVDDGDDGQQTVMMRAVQPPGSSAGPSGATEGFTGSSGSSSLSVTKAGVQAGADEPSGAGAASATEASAAAPSAAQRHDDDTVVDARERPADQTSQTAADGKDAAAGGPAAESAAAATTAATTAGSRAGEESAPGSAAGPDLAKGAGASAGGAGAIAGGVAAAAGAAGVAAAAAGGPDKSPDKSQPAGPPPAAAPQGPPAGHRTAQQPGWSPGRAGDSNLSGNDLFGSGATRPQEGATRPQEGANRPQEGAIRPQQGANRPQEGADRPPDGPPAGGPGRPPPPPGQWQPAAPAQGPDGRRSNGAGSQGAWQPPGGPQQAQGGEQQPPPGGAQPVQTGGGAPAQDGAPSGEPPEEQSDPAVAAVVATLEADVIVIDEQPRYHVPGCAALTGNEPIPLPAREAVELGFSPCGWCTPDRTLAARYPATAR